LGANKDTKDLSNKRREKIRKKEVGVVKGGLHEGKNSEKGPEGN